MSNALTGDYDAVVEVGIGTVNRLLATLHQKGAAEDASPKFLHSFAARIGDPSDSPLRALVTTFLLENLETTPETVGAVHPKLLQTLHEDLVEAQKAVGAFVGGLSNVIDAPAGKAGLVEALIDFTALTAVRGSAKVQVGTPTLILVPNSTSEVKIHADVRALFTPDPGMASLPTPLHGAIEAAFTARYTSPGGKPALEFAAVDDKNKVAFLPAPGTGITAPEAKWIARELRRFLKTGFKPMRVELPSAFPFRQFKSLVAGNSHAIALPVKLSGHVPAFALNSVNNLFLRPTDDYAIAISKDYIGEKLRPALQQIENFDYQYKVTDDVFDSTVFALHAWVSTASVVWEPGALVLVVTGAVKVWGWSVDDDQYDFTITQQLNLALDVAQQSVSLQPVGGITISGLPTTYKNLAKPKIENARDAALGTAQSVVHDALMGITFTDQLKTFDPSAQAKYKALEIDPAGVILRGTLTVSSRPPVVVSVTETAGGTALTALKSWVPAGTVDDYIWSWVTPDPLHPFLPWSGVEHAVSTPHQFIFSRPGGWESATHQVCLQVQGTQTGSVSSGSTGVSGGTTCHVEKPEWLAVIPSWWIDVLMVPIWTPDPPPDAILDDAIVAHMNVRPESGVSPGAATASIVHFTGDEVGAPLPALGEALLRSRHRGSAIPVIVVVPSGLFQHTRSSLEERLGRSVEELAGPLAVTEDYQEHWSQAFQPGDEPATFLMSAQGEVVWREVGPVQAASLAAALDEHATAGLRRQSVLLQPGVQVGEPAPEVLLEDGHGQGPLLRGGSETGVRLVFWKSWSSPCLKELRYLQRLQDQSPGEGPVILAIGDGEDPRQVDEIARQHDLRFALVGDPDRRVARGFEINCWPTTIQIDETGLVRSVHLGMTPEHGRQEVARAAGHH